VKVAKNKVAPPFKLAEFDIMYGKGISREGSLLDVAVDLGIIKKSGAWFTYEGEQLGQGRENAKQFLAENVDLVFGIMEKIKAAAGLDETVVDLTAAESPELNAYAAPEPEIDPERKPAAKANGKSSAKAKADLELNAEL
jgi:recombination protein RecA